MTELYKGFAGLIAVIFLAFYVTNLEKKREEEKALVTTDPIEESLLAFESGEFHFYEVWHHRYDEDGKQIGSWLLPGEKEIPEQILKEYADRTRIDKTNNIGLTQEQERFIKKARRWASSYNRHLGKLLTKLKP